MKINEHTALTTSKLLLVPYARHHVPAYHAWMQDPALQSATASEPLSLDEEYEMQASWRADHDKLTFIICRAASASASAFSSPEQAERANVQAGREDADDVMVGDVNLFLFDGEEDDDEDEAGGGESKGVAEQSMIGEVELMIARTDLRREGYGRAALLVFLDYVLQSWTAIAAEYSRGGEEADVDPSESRGEVIANLAYLRVKINQTNTASIALFESLHFEQTTAGPNFFGEIELRWKPDLFMLRNSASWEDYRILACTNDTK